MFVSFEIGTKNRTSIIIKTSHFLKNRGHGFTERLFPHMYTTLKGITPKIFLSSNIVRLQRILSEDLYFFIGIVTLIHLQDLIANDICGMRDILAKMSSFNLFFV